MSAKCSSCDTIIRTEAKFCSTCGNPVQQITQPSLTCKCGAVVPEAAKFCANCGNAVVSQQIPANITTSGNSQPMSNALTTIGETMTPEETVQWLMKFRKGTKMGTWIFFGIIVLIVFILVLFKAENLKNGLIGFSIFSGILFLLAFFTRRRTNQTWVGYVKNKRIIRRTKRDSYDGSTARVETDPTLYFKVKSGSKKLVVSWGMYDYFNIGDKIFKVSGMDYPELQELTAKGRACMVCGTIMQSGHPNKCRSCKKPVPDFISIRKEVGLN